jgi:hypothetical protein
VLSPSAGAETWAVARAAFVVLFVAALVVALERGSAENPAAKPDSADVAGLLAQLDPQVAFRDLPPDEQRTFRQVREGVTEAENLRGATGSWPSVAELREAGVPPFASDPIDRARYAWAYLRKGAVVNYVGVPSVQSGRPSFLVLIFEPDPGTPIDPQAKADELHHQLADGTVLHVSVFAGPTLRDLAEPVSETPIGKGWRRITVNP